MAAWRGCIAWVVLVAVCALVHPTWAATKSAGYAPSYLANCLREGMEAEGPSMPLTWDRAMKEESGTVRAGKMWWSTRNTRLPVTVVTQLSTGRLPQLEAQCRVWPGALSATIYVPLIEVADGDEEAPEGEADDDDKAAAKGGAKDDGGVQVPLRESQAATLAINKARNALSHMVQRYERQLTDMGGTVGGRGVSIPPGAYHMWELPAAELKALGVSSQNQHMLELAERAIAAFIGVMDKSPRSCQLRLMLAIEVVGDVRTANMLYPVNQLRNLARLQATTELVAQLDVDMLMSRDLATWLEAGANGENMAQDCRENRATYILPAFEAHAKTWEESAALSDKFIMLPKAQLELAVQQGFISNFDAKRFPKGHITTDFPRWFRTSDVYTVNYTYRFEPWLVVHRTKAPWHDVRFRGYGGNKIQQVSHLNASDYKFRVHPTGFIIHRAHPFTEARKQASVDIDRIQAQLEKLKLTTWKAAVRHESVNNTLFSHYEVLMDRIKSYMDEGTFETQLDIPTAHCIDTLPTFGGKKPPKNAM